MKEFLYKQMHPQAKFLTRNWTFSKTTKKFDFSKTPKVTKNKKLFELERIGKVG